MIKIFERDHIVDHVNAVAPYLTKRLDELVEELDCVTERKGKGLMQGIVVTKPLAEVNKRAIEEGILDHPGTGKCDPFCSTTDRGRKAY